MSRLKQLLHISSPSTGNTQQTMVQVCKGVAQHAHTTQQGCFIGVGTITAKQEDAIRAWMAHIEETDEAVIIELLDNCFANPEILEYLLKRAKELTAF